MSNIASLYLSLSADLAAPSDWNSVTLAGSTYDASRKASLVASGLSDAPTAMFIRPGGVSALLGTFVRKEDFYYETSAGPAYTLYFRGRLSAGDIVYYGSADGSAFYTKGSSIVIQNPNDAVIYFRKGTINALGEGIADATDVAGEAGLANVIGLAIPAATATGYGSVTMYRGQDYEEGEPVYLMGSAASQKAIVHFN